MTYPAAEALLNTARTNLQGANHRISVLQPEITDALAIQDGLAGQIPPPPFGGEYTEEPSPEFAAAVTAISDLATTLSARILPE